MVVHIQPIQKNKSRKQSKVSPIKPKHKAKENGGRVAKVTPIKLKLSPSIKVKVEPTNKLGKKKISSSGDWKKLNQKQCQFIEANNGDWNNCIQ